MKPRTLSVFRPAISFVALSLFLAGCGGENPAGPAPPANIAGTYTVTITASAGCAAQLAACGRQVTLTGDMTQSGATVTMVLRGDEGAALGFNSLGTVSGNALSMRIHFSDVNLQMNQRWQVCPPIWTGFWSGYFFEDGDFNGTISGRTISGTMVAIVQTDRLFGFCGAANHMVVFTKQ